MAANEPKLSPTQSAIRTAIRDQLVPIIKGSLISALELDDLTSALGSYLYRYSEKHGIEISDPSKFLGYVNEEEEADESTSWKAGLKYVGRIEVGKSKVVAGEEKEEKDNKDDKDKEKDEGKEWDIVSGAWKEERMDAVSSFIAAVQHIGEQIGG